jgi:hypothetical protein
MRLALETPGKTLMLLKKGSKASKESFKRKKIGLKTSLAEFKKDADPRLFS